MKRGVVPEALERVLEELEAAGELGRVKLMYVCSYHQNPTGLTLSEARRPRVLEILRRFSRRQRILLIEDAAYRELSYEGRVPASIRSFDAEGRFVAYVGTFSKPFAPGLKSGYGLLPSDLAEKVVLQKGHHDFGSANLCQYLLVEAMRSGVYREHVAKIRGHYALKCQTMLEALEKYLGGLCGGRVRWTRPSGGMYVWVSLPEEIETGPGSRLCQRALEKGVLYVPGEYCYPPGAGRAVPRHQMRLSFGTPSLGQIEEGVRRLAEAIREL